jgi:integrase/recombinase XerD
MRLKNWTKPTLYPKNPTPADMDKTWRVRFDFYFNNKRNMISRMWELNSIPSFKERLAESKIIVHELELRLKKGWNPVTNAYPNKTAKELELENLKNMSFSDALDFAFEKRKKNWSHKTKQDYTSVIRYFKIVGYSYLDKRIREFKKIDFKIILEETIEMRKGSEQMYNKYREYLSSLVSELVEWDILETNCIRDIKTRQTLKKVAHRPPTPEQRELIISAVKERNYPYYRFLAVLYGCTIRPKEITKIKIGYLLKDQGVFRLPAEITKNGKEADVPIPNWVMDILCEMRPENYPDDYYLFSGKGNVFMPGANRMHSNTTTGNWHKIVKLPVKKGGLGLDVDQYSLKKLAGDDMVRIQVSKGLDNLLSLPQRMMRHGSTSQTEDYVNAHKDVQKLFIQDFMPRLF